MPFRNVIVHSVCFTVQWMQAFCVTARRYFVVVESKHKKPHRLLTVLRLIVQSILEARLSALG